MKKMSLTAALLAGLMINGAALQASEMMEEIEVTEESPQMGYFSASVDRLKRCVTGKCTRYEALQAARDVGIAALATVAGLYAVGALAEKQLRKRGYKKGLGTAQRLQVPGVKAMRPVRAGYAKTAPLRAKLPKLERPGFTKKGWRNPFSKSSPEFEAF